MEQNKQNYFNVPNILTCIRLVLVGVFVYLFYAERYLASGVVFVSAAVTDFLDGYIARKWNIITDFGKLMDPLADKLMLIAALWCLYAKGFLSIVFVIIIAAKELIMITGGLFLYKNKVVVYSKLVGKLATLCFNVGIGAMILGGFFGEPVGGALKEAAPIILYIGLALAFIALVQYGYTNIIKRVKEKDLP